MLPLKGNLTLSNFFHLFALLEADRGHSKPVRMYFVVVITFVDFGLLKRKEIHKNIYRVHILKRTITIMRKYGAGNG